MTSSPADPREIDGLVICTSWLTRQNPRHKDVEKGERPYVGTTDRDNVVAETRAAANATYSASGSVARARADESDSSIRAGIG
jgi:hypothetical protein